MCRILYTSSFSCLVIWCKLLVLFLLIVSSLRSVPVWSFYTYSVGQSHLTQQTYFTQFTFFFQYRDNFV
ncbi:hypothetical protein L1887_40738 [Cichorium endivia]|nr:hypothetical protein L1887_40738 [Cichorium endivia]